MTPPLWQKAKKTKEALDEREESEKVGLKLNIQKTNITASGPITLWQIDGNTKPPYLPPEKSVCRSRSNS